MTPLRALLHHEPITFITTAMLAAWMLWFGSTLLSLPLVAHRRSFFRGPEELFSVRTWGWLFVAAGILALARLLLAPWRRLAACLDILFVAVTVAWAGAWFAGPMTAAQPAYALIAILTAGLPYINRIATQYLVLTPREGE